MGIIFIILLVVFLILLKPLLNELWTILQIVKSLFVPRRDLKRKYGTWAVITGCTDGIGKGFAFELAQRGLNIVLVSRNPAKLQATASEIEGKYNVMTKIVVADFGKGRVIYRHVENELKGMDIGILVNNVGIQYSYPMYFGELPESELWELLNVNIGSVTQMTRMILPEMLARKKGAIINLSSGSKLQPLPFMNLYAASKIFVDYFTDALRSEYKGSGLTIQSLCPYYVCTKINHFSDRLRSVNIFVPDADTYARHALNTVGIIDNTTGYWPHRLQYFMVTIVPKWIRVYIGGLMYKSMRNEYLKKKLKTKNCDGPEFLSEVTLSTGELGIELNESDCKSHL